LAWTYPTGGAVNSSPAVAGGVVYVASSDNTLYAFNAQIGKKLWSRSVAMVNSAITSSPAIANGILYIGSNDKDLYTYHLLGM